MRNLRNEINIFRPYDFYDCISILLMLGYFIVIDCCTFKPFEDSRCYLELVNQQYLVRSNPDNAHIDFTQCILVSGELHNPHSVHRQGEITLVFLITFYFFL